MVRFGVWVVVLCGTCLHVTGAQKAFERIDKFPDGEQGASLRSLTSIKDTNTVGVTVNAGYAKTWSAVKVVAQKFDKIGNRPVVGVNEASGRIQNGKIQLESMMLSGSLLDWRDEFVTEVTAVDSKTTKISVTRKLVTKELGSAKWGAHSSNGKIERWIITAVLDEINTPTAGASSGAVSLGGTVPPALPAQETEGSVFISRDNPGDILYLRDDKSFRVIERGRQASGQYEWSGDTLTLILGKQRLNGHLSGDTLTDNEGKLWTRKAQSNSPTAQVATPSAAGPPLPAQDRAKPPLTNDDVVEMVKGGLSEAVIISSIKKSQHQFETGPTALVALKKAGVSNPVIEVMIGPSESGATTTGPVRETVPFADGSKTLTRSKAKEILVPLVNQKQWAASFSGGFVGGGSALKTVLISRGLITPGNAFANASLTPAGAKEAAASHWECPTQGWRGLQIISGFCAIPTTSKIEVEVTGIQFSNATTAAVVYTLTGIPTAWGQTIKDAGLNLRQSGDAFGINDDNPQKSFSGTAVFQLYDDGWRVTTIN